MFSKEKKDDDAIRIGKQVFHQDEMEIPITYREEIFTLQYPNPFQKAQIEADIARRLNGLNRDAYPMEHLLLLEAVCYVDGLAIKGKCPEWFVSAHTCYDEELIGHLYRGYLAFRDKFRAKIRGDGSKEDGKGAGA